MDRGEGGRTIAWSTCQPECRCCRTIEPILGGGCNSVRCCVVVMRQYQVKFFKPMYGLQTRALFAAVRWRILYPTHSLARTVPKVKDHLHHLISPLSLDQKRTKRSSFRSRLHTYSNLGPKPKVTKNIITQTNLVDNPTLRPSPSSSFPAAATEGGKGECS